MSYSHGSRKWSAIRAGREEARLKRFRKRAERQRQPPGLKARSDSMCFTRPLEGPLFHENLSIPSFSAAFETVPFPKPLRTLPDRGVDGQIFCRYNTPSIQEDAYRLYPPEAEGHWRTE